MAYIDAFTSGSFNPSQAPFINAARLIAKVKSEADERPIAIGEVLRRMACRYLADRVGADAAAYLSPLQVGVAVKGGAEAVARGLTFLFHHHKRDPDVATVSIDGKNAYNLVGRQNMLNQVRTHFPSLARIAYFLYAGPAVLFFGKEHMIISLLGTHQGCPLGGLFFALAIHPLLTEIKVRLSEGGRGGEVQRESDLLMLGAYADNFYAVVKNKDRSVPILLGIIDGELGQRVGYIRGRNCFIVCPAVPFDQAMDIDNGPQDAPTQLFGLPLKHNYVAVGYPIGDPVFMHDWLVGPNGNGGKLAKLNKVADLVDGLEDSQTKLYLLTRSVVQHAPYLTRLIPRAQLEQLLVHFEARIRRSLAGIAGRTAISDQAWRQAKLPYKYSGLQLQDPLLTADAAYLGSLSSFGLLTFEILGLAPGQNDGIDLLRIAPEAEAIVARYNAASGMTYDVRAFPTGLSQKDLAEPLHEREFNSYIETLTPESRARVLSSSGLRSCPQRHLLRSPQPQLRYEGPLSCLREDRPVQTRASHWIRQVQLLRSHQRRGRNPSNLVRQVWTLPSAPQQRRQRLFHHPPHRRYRHRT